MHKLDSLVPPETLARFRHALAHDTSGTIPEIMKRTGCNQDKAIDTVLHWVYRGVVRLLLMANGECLIDLVPNPAQTNEIIVDAEVNRILKGRTTLERDMDAARGVVGRTVLEMPRGKLH